MFTGIVTDVGTVTHVEGGELRVRVERLPEHTQLGDSIAVNGVDLTVTRLDGGEMSFDVMPETFRQTALGRFEVGTRVNIEPSLRPSDRISGHIVRGVVEGTATVAERRDDGDAVVMSYRTPRELLDNIVERGPVCVDGVSLTVIAKTDETFSVSVVKYTQSHTTTLEREVGDPVNIETDILMRYVQQALRAGGVLPGGG